MLYSYFKIINTITTELVPDYYPFPSRPCVIGQLLLHRIHIDDLSAYLSSTGYEPGFADCPTAIVFSTGYSYTYKTLEEKQKRRGNPKLPLYIV